jgi:hypothetical protein
LATHTLASSTFTVEMLQVIEVNDRLASLDPTSGECLFITAEFLGLTGAQVHPRIVDRAAAQMLPRQDRQHETLALPASSLLRSILAAGDPSFPYLYGVFGEPGVGRRRLPVVVHTQHLQRISSVLELRRHRWGL